MNTQCAISFVGLFVVNMPSGFVVHALALGGDHAARNRPAAA